MTAFREATTEDLQAVVALIIDDEVSSAGEASDSLDPGYLAGFEEVSAQPGNRIIVGIGEDDNVVACLQLIVIAGVSRVGMRRAQIEHVRVARSLRGLGIGHQIMEYAIGVARSEGCGMVQLTANTARADAHRFYESLGFESTHVGYKLGLD